MFGLGKTERAMKQLRSALGIYIPGDRDTQQAVIDGSAKATADAIQDIADGIDPYQASAILLARYIRKQIEEQPPDIRQRMLRVITNEHAESLPRLIKFTAHISLDLARLESGSKPIVAPGTTGKFLDIVAEGFAPQENVRKRIAGYLYACATKLAENGRA